MKKKYEKPVVDVFVFETPDTVMDSGECMSFNCPDGICTPDYGCIMDDICIAEPNYSGVY